MSDPFPPTGPAARDGAIRVVAMMESLLGARWISGPAKNLIAFAARLRESPPPGLPRVEFSVAAFERPSSPDDIFLAALRAARIPVHVIREEGAGDLRVFPQLRAIVAQASPDILQTHNSKSHVLARAAWLQRPVRWIAFHHGFTRRDRRDRFYNMMGRWALRGAPRVVTVCQAFARDLALAGVPAHRISVRHNMVDPFPPSPPGESAELRRGLGIHPRARVLLTVGRLSSEKGHSDLLEALAFLRDSRQPSDIRLVIVGDGPERQALERRCAGLGISAFAVFTGQQEAVAPYYRIADFFILPSHSEGSPNVLLEAMTAGLPIVSTAAGGTVEVVEDGQTALLVEPSNPPALGAAIRRLLGDPELAARLGAAARDASRRFAPEAYTAALVELYRDVLAGAPPG